MTNQRVAWDTSVWIAWLQQQDAHNLEAIEEIVVDIESGRCRLLVPTVVIHELFHGSPGNEALQKFLSGPSVAICDLTEPIAKRSAEIQRACKQELGFKPRTPDVMIVATAEFFNATVLYTFDSAQRNIGGIQGIGLRIEFPVRRDRPGELF